MSYPDGSTFAESAERIFRQLQDGVDDDGLELPEGVREILKLLAANASDLPGDDRLEPTDGDALGNGVDVSSIEIGRFRLSRCLGQGGYGVVYLVRHPLGPHGRGKASQAACPVDQSVARSVSTRSSRSIGDSSSAHRSGIRCERSRSSLLHCERILRRRITGRLARKQEGPLDPRTVAQLMMPISDAVHHAHLAGILHRDLKPGNILLKSTSANQMLGIPYVAKVADFGLAKLQTHNDDETTSGAILEAFATWLPNRRQAATAKSMRRSDIYSLGVIIYQLLTGALPFTSESQLQLLRDVVEKTPVSIRNLSPSTPRRLGCDLHEVPGKETFASLRHGGWVGEDLKRFLDGQPTVARPINPLEAAVRWSIQYPTKAILAGVICLSLFAGITGLIIHSRMMSEALVEQTRVAENLEQREKQLRTENYASDTAIGFNAWHKMRPKQTSALLAFQRQQPNADSYLGIESHLLNQLVDPPSQVLYQSEFPVHGLLLPDGHSYAFVEGSNQVHFIHLQTGRHTSSLNSPFAALRELAVSADGRYLAVSSETPRNSQANARPPSRVGVFDLIEGGFREIGQHENTVESLAFAPDGSELVSAARYENLLRQNLNARMALTTDPNLSRNESVCFSPDGKMLAYSAFNPSNGAHYLRLNELETGRVSQHRLRRKDEYLCFSHDGKWLAVSNVYRIQIFDTDSFEVVEALSDIHARTAAIAFTPDDRFIAVATRDGAIRFWEQRHDAKEDRIADRRFERRFNPVACTNHHEARIRSMSFDHQQRLITAGEDGSIRICDLATFLKPKSIGPDAGSVRAMDHLRDGTIVLALSDGRHWVKRPKHAPLVAMLNKRSGSERRVAVSSDAQWMAYSVGNRLGVVGTDDMQPMDWQVPQVGTDVNGLCFTPSGERLLTTHMDDRHVYVWDVAQRSLVDTIEFPRPITAARFTSDGKTFIVCETDPKNTQMFVCDGATLQRYRQIPLKAGAFATRFDANDQILAIGHIAGQISLWNTSVWEETHWLVQHDPVWIYALAFSRDGRTLASGCDDGSIRLWHVETGVELGNLSRDTDIKVRGLMFPEDGRSLVVANVIGGPPLVEYSYQASQSARIERDH